MECVYLGSCLSDGRRARAACEGHWDLRYSSACPKGLARPRVRRSFCFGRGACRHCVCVWEAGGVKPVSIDSMYGLVLLLDPRNEDVAVPENGGRTVASTSSCVAIPVRPYVDGRVQLIFGPAAAGSETVFSGSVETPSGSLAFELPEENDPVLAAAIGGTHAAVVVAVDDPESPAMVWVDVAGRN
jgi:hypothetical protein